MRVIENCLWRLEGRNMLFPRWELEGKQSVQRPYYSKEMVIQRLFLLSGKAADGCREGMAPETWAAAVGGSYMENLGSCSLGS